MRGNKRLLLLLLFKKLVSPLGRNLFLNIFNYKGWEMFVVEKMFSRTLTADGLVEVGGRCGSCGRVVGDQPDPPAADV